jgi:hypothetical protein
VEVYCKGFEARRKEKEEKAIRKDRAVQVDNYAV